MIPAEQDFPFGDGPFDDAWALAWVDELLEDGWWAVRLPLVGASDIERALADNVHTLVAAEVVAAAMGRPHTGLPDEVVRWVERHRSEMPTELVALAQEGVVRLARKSDLKDAVRARRRIKTWLYSLADLCIRLGSRLPEHLVPRREEKRPS